MKTTTLFSFLAVALAALSGCAGSQVRPELRSLEVDLVEIRDQDFTEFSAAAKMSVAAGLEPVSARWEILSGEPLRPLAAGESTLGAEAVRDGVIEVAGRAPYAEPEALGELMERGTPLSIVMRGSVQGSDGSEWEFSRAGLVRVPRTPEIKVHHVEAASQPGLGRIDLVFYIHVENRNPFEIQLQRMRYDLSINGQQMIAGGIAGSRRRVPSAAMVGLEIPLSLDAESFPEVERYLRPGSDLRYLLDGVVELTVGHIPIELKGPIQIGSGG